MHKLVLAQEAAEEEAAQTEAAQEMVKHRNPFAPLEESTDDEDDTHLESLSEQDKKLFKNMTKEERREHKKQLEELENAYKPDYIFPKQTWWDTWESWSNEMDKTRLHDLSWSRHEYNKILLTLKVQRNDVNKKINQLSYTIDEKIKKLANLVLPFVDDDGKYPPFDLIPSNMTDNPESLFHDILSETKQLASNQKTYASLTNQYDMNLELRDLFHDNIALEVEIQQLEKSKERIKSLNSDALRAALVKRRVSMMDLNTTVEEKKLLFKSGDNSDLKTESTQDKANEMFNLRFASMLKSMKQQTQNVPVVTNPQKENKLKENIKINVNQKVLS